MRAECFEHSKEKFSPEMISALQKVLRPVQFLCFADFDITLAYALAYGIVWSINGLK